MDKQTNETLCNITQTLPNNRKTTRFQCRTEIKEYKKPSISPMKKILQGKPCIRTEVCQTKRNILNALFLFRIYLKSNQLQ